MNDQRKTSATVFAHVGTSAKRPAQPYIYCAAAQVVGRGSFETDQRKGACAGTQRQWAAAIPATGDLATS